MVHKTFDMKYIAYFQSWVQFDFRKYKIQICHNGDFTEKTLFIIVRLTSINLQIKILKTEFVSEDS